MKCQRLYSGSQGWVNKNTLLGKLLDLWACAKSKMMHTPNRKMYYSRVDNKTITYTKSDEDYCACTAGQRTSSSIPNILRRHAEFSIASLCCPVRTTWVMLLEIPCYYVIGLSQTIMLPVSDNHCWFTSHADVNLLTYQYRCVAYSWKYELARCILKIYKLRGSVRLRVVLVYRQSSLIHQIHRYRRVFELLPVSCWAAKVMGSASGLSLLSSTAYEILRNCISCKRGHLWIINHSVVELQWPATTQVSYITLEVDHGIDTQFGNNHQL